MTAIENLMKDAAVAEQKVQEAKQTRKAALEALHDALKIRFKLYCKTFEPLNEWADTLNYYRIPEIHEDGFHDDWGNNGLARVTEEGAFTHIYTNDYFRGERDEFMASIPSKYLLNAGEQAMREDAARVQSELDTLQKQKDAKVEQAQREEYARLKRRFG